MSETKLSISFDIIGDSADQYLKAQREMNMTPEQLLTLVIDIGLSNIMAFQGGDKAFGISASEFWKTVAKEKQRHQ